METLKINNFITLSQVDIEIKRYNVLIGRQSSGKSLIAKLLYFFKSDFPSAFLSTIKGDEENSPEDANSARFKKRLDEKLFQSFLEIFNPDYWGSGDFLIEYTNDDHKIIIGIICRMSPGWNGPAGSPVRGVARAMSTLGIS